MTTGFDPVVWLSKTGPDPVFGPAGVTVAAVFAIVAVTRTDGVSFVMVAALAELKDSKSERSVEFVVVGATFEKLVVVPRKEASSEDKPSDV